MMQKSLFFLGAMGLNKTLIRDYYDTCESDYRMFWDLDKSLAMHAGFWDETTTSLRQALRRENEVLAETVQITSSDKVLDAGCGIGGSSIFLAKKYGCRVTGITLSGKQVKKAKDHAIEFGVAHLTTFMEADFCRTPFEDAFFDVVWGLESVCHADDKRAFIKEAYRVLKPGGRLVVADGFLTRPTASQSEACKMSLWLKGWGVESLEMVSDFESHLQREAFKDVMIRDIKDHVIPSSKRLYLISFPAFLFSKLGEWVGLRQKIQTDNIVGARYQYRTLKDGLWTYAIFSARK